MKVCVGLRQSNVMSLWLFNMLMIGVIRDVTETTVDVGVTLWNAKE